MQEYELTVLIQPDLEARIEEPLAKVRDIVANSIRKEDFAVYVYFEAELPSDAPLKISNTLNITDEVLRYLLVKVDHKGRALLAESQKSEDSEA